MISTTIFTSQYVGNGVTTVFPYIYPFYEKNQVVVLSKPLGGIDTTLTIGVEYTLTGGIDGGTVTLLTPPATGTVITITRNTDIVQLLDLVENEAFKLESVEIQLDKIVMMIQELASIVAGETSVTPSIATIGLPTGTLSQQTISVNTSAFHKITAWLVVGTATVPTVEYDMVPPDGSPGWGGEVIDIADTDGNKTFVFNHAGAFRTWKLCVEVAGLVVMSEAFSMGS